MYIYKVANVTNAVVGDLIKYTITVRNAKSSDVTDVHVWDVLPAGFEFKGGNGHYDQGTRNVTWTIDKIEAGKSVSVYLVVNVTAIGKLNNTAFANCQENRTPINKTSDNITVGPDVKLNISKELVTVCPIYAGDNITYSIVITNNGFSEATLVEVTDIVKGSGEIISCVDNNGKSYSGSVWTIDSIAAGQSVTLTVIVHVTAEGMIANNVTAKSKENNTPVTNETPEAEVLPDVKLNITKELVTVGPIYVGDDITYTITISNNGESVAHNVVVNDTIKGNGVIVSCKDDNGKSYDGSVWTIDSVAAHDDIVLTVIVHVTGEGTIANNVTARSDENDTNVSDETPDENVLPDVKLNITKELVTTGPIYVGDDITYTINVTNNGNSVAHNVVVNDVIKGSGVIVSCKDNNGKSYSGSVWTIDSIGNHSDIVLTVVVHVTGEGTIANNVTARSDENDTNVSDETPERTIPMFLMRLLKQMFLLTLNWL